MAVRATSGSFERAYPRSSSLPYDAAIASAKSAGSCLGARPPTETSTIVSISSRALDDSAKLDDGLGVVPRQGGARLVERRVGTEDQEPLGAIHVGDLEGEAAGAVPLLALGGLARLRRGGLARALDDAGQILVCHGGNPFSVRLAARGEHGGDDDGAGRAWGEDRRPVARFPRHGMTLYPIRATAANRGRDSNPQPSRP